MSYKPLIVINALKSVPGVTSAAVAAVTARLLVLESVSGSETAKIAMECGLVPEQALALCQALDAGGPAASPLSPLAAASGAPQVCMCVPVRMRVCVCVCVCVRV